MWWSRAARLVRCRPVRVQVGAQLMVKPEARALFEARSGPGWIAWDGVGSRVASGAARSDSRAPPLLLLVSGLRSWNQFLRLEDDTVVSNVQGQ